MAALDARNESRPFSILERIDVGETSGRRTELPDLAPFSILERIDVGETFSSLSGLGCR